MKRNIINRVADLMLSEDDEMKSLGRALFLENSPRQSDIAVLENIIYNRLNPVESRFSKLESDIKYSKRPQNKYHDSSTTTSTLYGGTHTYTIGYNGTSSLAYGLGTLTLNEG